MNSFWEFDLYATYPFIVQHLTIDLLNHRSALCISYCTHPTEAGSTTSEVILHFNYIYVGYL